MCHSRTLAGLCLVLALAVQVNTECSYQGVVFAAGSTVPVSEPCLRCVCARSALLCQLRVCPELPDPPPPGCVAVHRRKACCPQLLCQDDPVTSNRIEARIEPDLPEFIYNHSVVGNGCVHGGTLYGAGSAMHTSSRCSYCYCIAGRQQCVRPRCLLPAPGCAPVFRPLACCPTSYKCRATHHNTTHQHDHDPDSCLVHGVRVAAGARATAAARTPCDACYCVRGAVRCTPLRCAPALPGCTPLVPPGTCCPTSYNCSGTIEVQPLLNYDKPPDVSPEYAKLRHGTQHSDSHPLPDTKYPHYILPHSQTYKPSNPYYFTSTAQPGLASIIPTSRQYIATTKHLPLENPNPESSAKYSRISLTTTRVANGARTEKSTTISSVLLSPVYKPGSDDSNYVDTDLSDDGYVDGRNNRRINDQLDLDSNATTTTDYTTESVFTTEPTTEWSTTTESIETTTYFTTTDLAQDKSVLIEDQTTTEITVIGNNSECIEAGSETTTVTAEPTTVDNLDVSSSETDVSSSETEATNLSATTVPFKKIPADIEAVNKKDEDYEYDYNLQPNLEIIPFVAADAVVEQGTGTAFPPHQDALRETDDPLFPYTLNLFSPPQETEGGFVPRDPPLLYDSGYHSSAAAPGGSVDRVDGSDCVVFGREVQHGALAPAGPACARCLCLFGAVICQPPACNEGAEAPTLVLDEAPVQDTAPFRDVIRTEPAPGLHELIGDLQQHQQHHPATDSDQIHKQEEKKQQPEEEAGDSFYDTLYQLLGGGQTNTTSTTPVVTTTTAKYRTTNMPWSSTQSASSPAAISNTNSIEEASTALGLLKLAGCNIYGRMYRVGKIIAELSGPCLQCRCTDTGVQCASLPC